MPLIGGGKKAKKTSSSSTKRHFTVVMGNKEHGLYVSSSPSSAARKAVSKLCATDKKKKVQFSIREITHGSKKKTYGPYVGKMKKLDKPIELKGRIIKYSTDVYLDKILKKSFVKKGGAPRVSIGFTIDTNKLMLYINEKYKNELHQERISNGFTEIKLASFGYIDIKKINRMFRVIPYRASYERIAIYACYFNKEIKCYAIARCASVYDCTDRKDQPNYKESIKRRISRPCNNMESKILFLFKDKSEINMISESVIYNKNLPSLSYKGEFTFKSFISSDGDKYRILIEKDNTDSLFNFFMNWVNNIQIKINNNLVLPEITIRDSSSSSNNINIFPTLLPVNMQM